MPRVKNASRHYPLGFPPPGETTQTKGIEMDNRSIERQQRQWAATESGQVLGGAVGGMSNLSIGRYLDQSIDQLQRRLDALERLRAALDVGGALDMPFHDFASVLQS